MKLEEIVQILKTNGMLLQSDAAFPSLAQLITGEGIKGSWWGHPRGKEIFNMSNALEDHADVMVTKLVSEKVTFVHRRLWAAVVGAGKAQDAWQMQKLSPIARALFDRVQREGKISPEALVEGRSASAKSFGPYITELEKRLLVQGEQIHTDSGAHARIIYSWDAWIKQREFRDKIPAAKIAQSELAKALQELNSKFRGNGTLPW